jgi:anaerobic selenocysteine-containing dehydrogenase
VLSTPNSGQLAQALGQLDFMLSVDVYLNETTRHAHVILPPPSPLERGHYDLAFYQLSVRNIARYSPAIFAAAPGHPQEWEILLRLAGIVSGQGAATDPAALDDGMAQQLIRRETKREGSRVAGRDPAELLAALAPRRGPERLLDFMLRTGPYGDGFAGEPDGQALTLATLETAPHGRDLGPLQPRIPEVLRTPSGKIELAPPAIMADVARLQGALAARPAEQLVLIGRRELRSNNSWMHNLRTLTKGAETCLLLVHPDDARRLGLADGAPARVTSAAGCAEAPVRVTDAIMPGVVSLPHGWGHDAPGTQLRVAADHPGANVNALTGELAVDPLSGNAILNGVAVTVAPAGA